MARPLADAVSAGQVPAPPIWDGGPWDMEEGVDFPVGEWRHWAVHMKAVAALLGGKGSAAEIVYRNKKGEVIQRVYRWMYLPRKTGWRDGL